MKKLTLFLILNLSINFSFSQTCLPNGITLTSQASVDAFQTNYPNCQEILGRLRISGEDIQNLDGLSQITSVGDYVEISECFILSDISGLGNLTYVGESFSIDECDSLPNLNGLNNLTHIGDGSDSGIFLFGNDNLQSISGLTNVDIIGDIRIEFNPKLQNLNGLESIDSLGWFHLVGNTELNDLSGLDNLFEVTSGLEISNSSNLITLNGLESLSSIPYGTLFVENNPSLININGLSNVERIGGIRFVNNQNLEDINGLSSLMETELITIQDNPLLSFCSVNYVCDYILDGYTPSISNNLSGCNSVQEVEDACLSSTSEFNTSVIKIYPNLVSELLFIKKETSKTLLFEINDLTGRLISEGKIINELHSIPFTKMNTGIYFVKIIDPQTEQFIVEKIFKKNKKE